MRFLALLVLVSAGMTARAAPPSYDRTDAAVRWTVAPMGAVYARYPGSMEDPGGGLEVTRSLLGPVGGRWVEARLDLAANAGFGRSGTAYLLVAPAGRVNLHLLSWFSLELLLGVGAGTQLGASGVVPTAGLYGGGGYVFAPFEDKRRRISLRLKLAAMAALRRDPGNDLGVGAGLMGVGLGYEHAFD